MAGSRADNGRVLVVDDDDSIRDLVTTALGFVGYQVQAAATGRAALSGAAGFRPDLIVLDVMLPDIDGTEVCRRLRADGDATPVIFLTARDSPDDTVNGFSLGADDYLTKPFHLPVLLARIDAVLRRTRPSGDDAPRLAFGDLELDQRGHQVWRGGRLIDVSPTEFRLLRYLMLNPGVVVSKPQIAEHLWQFELDGDANIVETHMSYLRKKLGPPRLIQTLRGVGYVLRAANGGGVNGA